MRIRGLFRVARVEGSLVTFLREDGEEVGEFKRGCEITITMPDEIIASLLRMASARGVDLEIFVDEPMPGQVEHSMRMAAKARSN